MKENIKLYLLNIFGYLAANPAVLIALGTVLLLIMLGWGLNSCHERRQKKEIEKIESNIQNASTNAIANIRKEANNETQNLSVNTNLVINRDSNSFANDWNRVRSKFCERFPADSKCAR